MPELGVVTLRAVKSCITVCATAGYVFMVIEVVGSTLRYDNYTSILKCR